MRRIGGGLAFSVLVALSACGSSGSDEPGLDTMEIAPLRDRPAGTLSWQPCGNVECATLEVPIDHANPALGTLPLALNRVRANAAAGYRGTVLVNPGGPGAPGKPYVAASAAALRRFLPGFDFIGFDPRGIGDSAALPCQMPDNVVSVLLEEGSAGYFRVVGQASAACAEQVGPLFDNMGTNQVVADLELVRQALEEEEINLLGISYGTRLGALYARLYPEHARAVVLDGPLAPVPDIRRQTESQFAALLELHQEFFDDCAAGVLRCPPEPEAVFEAMAADSELPLPLLIAIANWKLLLSSVPGRELAAQSLRVYAGEEPPPDMMAGMAAAMEALPVINVAANLSTNCADDTSPPLSVEEADQLIISYAKREPAFFLEGLPALTCTSWVVRRDPLPSLDFEPRVAPLVIGGTRDVLTPYDLAQETVRVMDGAGLLTSEHYGHSAVNLGEPTCVLGYVRRYLETLQLPAEGARCGAPSAR